MQEELKRDALASLEERAWLERFGHKLTVQKSFTSSPIKISILTCCYRYMQRFRIFMQSLCKQDCDLSQVEIVVANPHSSDGLSAYIATLKRAFQWPAVEEVLVESTHYRNRGLLIQEGFLRSRGEIVIGMDCDLILPSDFITRITGTLAVNPSSVVGVYRNFLTPKTTAAILAGVIDPFLEFELLKNEDQEEVHGYRGVLGYCQATSRKAWEEVGYPIEFNEIAKSDVEFVERLKKISVMPLFMRDLIVLHLNHERNWMGTEDFL